VTVVLIVVIVLLLAVLGAGTMTVVRRNQLGGADRPPEPEVRDGDAPAQQLPEPSPPGEDRGTPSLDGAGSASPREPEPGTVEPGRQERAAPAGTRPRLSDRLGRAKSLLGGSLTAIRGRARVDDATFDELEEALLLADVGLPLAGRLLEDLRSRVRSGEVADNPTALLGALKADVIALFAGEDRDLRYAPESPSVWLFVGVNGVGKTTTIGKLAARESEAGRSVVVAAGDTFRAAAGDQLATWAERSGAGIVRGADGADPSSVVFDAVQHAAARGADLVLADTAGRLHTKVNLMDELRKVRRVADRPPGHVSEVLLVLDATTGQNGLVQAREFAGAVEVTGVVLTKLDGTAKGGIVCAIRSELGLPIKLVGLGEGANDLVAFDPEEFAEALFS
jgi:fused signal recognition particle receptor